jgi:hypothetical protein
MNNSESDNKKWKSEEANTKYQKEIKWKEIIHPEKWDREENRNGILPEV